MDCEFSEFSYGYACMREAEADLTQLLPLAASPEQPSLLEENVVGYDAALYSVDFALLLQFKRSTYISMQHTSVPCAPQNDHPQRCSWYHLGEPHYRFDVDTNSNQWHAMRAYEDEFAMGGVVGMSLYLAPLFHTGLELDDAYAQGDVLQRSMWVSPSEFPADRSAHRYATTADETRRIRLSEPSIPERSFSWPGVRDQILGAISNPEADRPGASLAELRELLWSYGQGPARPSHEAVSETVADVVRDIRESVALLGAGIVLIGHQTAAGPNA